MEIKRDNIKSKIIGESTGVLEINNEVIPLPQPALTSTDINYADIFQRKSLKTFNFPHYVHETREHWFNGEKWKKIDEFVGSPKYRQKKLDWLNGQIVKARNNGKPIIFIYTPLISKNITITVNFADALVAMELKSDLTMITIPIPDLERNEQGAWIKARCLEVKKAGRVPILLVEQNKDEIIFNRYLSFAKKYTDGVNVVFSKDKKYYFNLIALAVLGENNFLRILSNVDFRFSKKDATAFLPLGFLFADIVCSKLGRRIKKENEEISEENEITNALRLDTITGGYLTINQYKEHYPDLALDECPPDRGNSIEDVSIDYQGYIRTAFRIHDVFEMYNFFIQVANYIKFGTLEKHLNKRIYWKEKLKTLVPANVPLNKYT